jgi:DNA helicase II / ATP-dependent DNA helicase PcrA
MEFNEEQLQAIHCSARHLLVLAGAGTGKTRTIIGRAAQLIRSGCSPKRIAVITFTRRAAAEIRHRLNQDVGETHKGIVAGTFHNFCLREMSAHRSWFGLDEITVMDADDQSQLMKLVRAEIVGKRKDSSVPQSPQLLNYYSYARNTNQPIREYLKHFTELEDENIDVVLRIFDGYKDRKRAAGYVDFDDILHRFAKVMKQETEICQRIASSYDHVLVDEMQDTNPLQWLILESLATHVQLFCVGDDAQSIYAFRGADFRNVHSFAQRVPDAQVLKLELNYRSTQEILDVSNWLLTQSPLKYNKKLTAFRGPGNPPIQVITDTEDEEAEWVAEYIVKQHQQGTAWQEQMVLCRTAYSARPLEAELIRRKIPYRFIGGIGLLQMAHIKDLLSALRIVVNHQDELAWMRYLMMWPRIGEVTAAKLVGQLRVCEVPPAAVERLQMLSGRPEITNPLRDSLENMHSPSVCIENLIRSLEELLSQRYDNWDQRKRDCQLIVRLAQKHKSVQSFLDAYALDPVSASEVDATDDDLLTLITVHSAKGTEAKICYVIAAQSGNYPHSRSLENEDDIEEERRVLYVALTRAQDQLVISRHMISRGSWNSWKQPQTCFLDDLPGKLVQRRIPTNSGVGYSPHRKKKYSADYWDDDVI